MCVCIPAICKEELEVGHVDLPQRNTVALSQRQSDSVNTIIQCPKHTGTKTGRKKVFRLHLIKAEIDIISHSCPSVWYEQSFRVETKKRKKAHLSNYSANPKVPTFKLHLLCETKYGLLLVISVRAEPLNVHATAEPLQHLCLGKVCQTLVVHMQLADQLLQLLGPI